MKTSSIYLALVYVLVIIATSAGSIYHGVEASEHFYTVMGVLNFIFGCVGAYKIWRSENPKTE